MVARADRIPLGRPRRRRLARSPHTLGRVAPGHAEPRPAARVGGARRRGGRPCRPAARARPRRVRRGQRARVLRTHRRCSTTSPSGCSGSERGCRRIQLPALASRARGRIARRPTVRHRTRHRHGGVPVSGHAGAGATPRRRPTSIAWRRGRLALTVLASGGGASAKTVGALARALDRLLSPSRSAATWERIPARLDSPEGEESNRSTRTQAQEERMTQADGTERRTIAGRVPPARGAAWAGWEFSPASARAVRAPPAWPASAPRPSREACRCSTGRGTR